MDKYDCSCTVGGGVGSAMIGGGLQDIFCVGGEEKDWEFIAGAKLNGGVVAAGGE